MDGSRTIPSKVLQHFHLIPRLLRSYRCKSLGQLLTYHKDGVSSYGFIQSVVDSMAWKHINEKWPKFANDARNIWLGLALDGTTTKMGYNLLA